MTEHDVSPSVQRTFELRAQRAHELLRLLGAEEWLRKRQAAAQRTVAARGRNGEDEQRAMIMRALRQPHARAVRNSLHTADVRDFHAGSAAVRVRVEAACE